MRTTDWDAVAASSPINGDAARAYVYGYGDEAPILLSQARADIAPEIARDPSFKSLIGLQKGWLTVIAFRGRNHRKESRWIVRCICNRLEVRSRKALRPDNPNDRCTECNQLQRLRDGHGLPEMKKAPAVSPTGAL